MKVLVATSELAVFDALRSVEGVECQEELFTGGLFQELPGAQLVIVDFDRLVPHPYSVAMIQKRLENAGVPYVSSIQFLAEPDRWILKARRVRGENTGLPAGCIVAFASYSGGTGKTVLAIDTALHFAHRTRLPVLLTELTYGASALAALTGQRSPHLFDLTTQPDAVAAVVREDSWQAQEPVPWAGRRGSASLKTLSQ